MINRALGLYTLSVVVFATGARGQALSDGHTSSAPSTRMAELEEVVIVDGKLNERVWRTAVAATDFRQSEPEEGDPATQRTEVRFANDGEALYVGARMFDSLGAEGVRTRLARRDQEVSGDWLELTFDTFHDHSGQTVFQVNPSGVKRDAGQASPHVDASWDPIWTMETQIDSLGWTAELRIPLSQIRFPRDSVQTWGLQIFRYVERLNETSMWSFWDNDDSGGPPRFGHLTEVRSPDELRAFEFMPYTTMRAAYLMPTQPGSPFQAAREYGMLAGGDVKALITSAFALDATINPDFGQVEVDPAVVNLSAFETFLPEKRPFFVSGSGLFGFGGFSCFFCSNVSGMSLFYSRRIGRRPQGHVTTPSQYVEVPDHSGILGAAKITGRTRGGLELGLLNAVTASEHARLITEEGESLTREVEPLTNYFVGRVRRTYRDGDLRLGAIGTSVLRRFGHDALGETLPARASALGIDWRAAFDDHTYFFEGNLAASHVAGDPAAIERLQTSSARYFDRPDRQQGRNGIFSNRYDPDLAALRGFGGYARMAKQGGGLKWETAVNFRSPGFEVNDLAFLTSADYVWMNANILHEWTEPTRYYRRFYILGGGQQQFNFDGDRTGREGRLAMGGEAPNYWNFNGFLIARASNFDDRLTRGGPVVRRPSLRFVEGSVNTDSRKSVTFGSVVGYGWDDDGGRFMQLSGNVQLKPSSNVSISVGPRYTRDGGGTQFVASFDDLTATHFHGRRTVVADLVQRSLSMDTRVGVTFSPTLTFELFAQPLVASGAYSRFKEFDAPRTVDTSTYGEDQISTVLNEEGQTLSYVLDPDRDAATPAFTFENPDFNLRSLRGSAVVRWEYRPGSTLFFVWQQNRNGREPFGDMVMSRDVGAIFEQDSDNVFMVKATYWFGR